MPLHTAKGLEFPVVFVTGWEDGNFPHMRALGDAAELAEERRLAYVGITRARQRLYLTRAIMRSAWGQPVSNSESRFLQEIPGELVDWRRLDPTRTLRAGGGFGSGRERDWTAREPARPAWRREGFGRPAPGTVRGLQTTDVFKVGDRVNHQKYGLGTVISQDTLGAHPTVTIDFGSAGKVRVIPGAGAPMEKL